MSTDGLRRVAYYKGCLASMSAKELDTSTQALAPRVGLELVELESVTCCGAGDIHEAEPDYYLHLNARILAYAEAAGCETLLTVSRKFGVSRGDIAEANNLSIKSRLRPGQELMIPRAPATLLAARTERTAPSAVASRSIAETAESPAAAGPSTAEPAQVAQATTYRVKRGDTLFSIAQLFDTTVAKIKSWNRLSSNRLTVGSRLKIMTARQAAGTTSQQ